MANSLDIAAMVREAVQQASPGSVIIINIMGGDGGEPDADDDPFGRENDLTNFIGGGSGGTSAANLMMEANSPSSPISGLGNAP